MKKIVGILAAAAVAASAFAADVSASTKIGGKLFNYAGNKIELLTENNDSHDYANPNMTFSISDDKAGATVKLTTDGGNKTVAMTTQTIWFKPIDALKITVGNFDIALNKETICYTESVTGLGGNGYLLSVNVEGFGLDLGLDANGAFWFTKDGNADAALKAFFVKAGYSADFGSIGAFVKFNNDSSKGYFKYADKAGSIKNILFGAGYKNTIDPITFFVNVSAYMGNTFEWVRPEVFVSGSVDAFSFAAFVAPIIIVDSNVSDKFDAEVVAKLSYQLDSVNIYAQFKDASVMASPFTSEIQLGASGSCGAMGWKTWFQINTAASTSFAVPVEFSINF
jgi:hypothetical protein